MNMHLSGLFCIFISTYQRAVIKAECLSFTISHINEEENMGFETVRSHKLVFSLESHMEQFQQQISLFLIRLCPGFCISIIFW